jgi:hypothetical protein
MNRPIRVAEHLAGQKDQVGLALGDKGVRLAGVSDHAHSRGGNAGFSTDPGGKRRLEAGTDGNSGVGDLAAGGDVNKIDTARAEEPSEFYRLVDGPAALSPIRGGDADEEGQMSRPCGAHSVHNFKKQAGAVEEAAAVSVGAVVGKRGEEFMEQVAMGRMNLNEVKSCCERPLCTLCKGVDDGGDSGLIEGLGYSVVGSEGYSAGGDGLPAAFFWKQQAFAAEGYGHAAFAAGVGQLNTGADALRMDEADDLLEAWDVRIFPDAKVSGGDAAFREDGGSLEQDEARTTLSATAKMDEMPVVGESVLRRILAHGRDADAIGKGDGTKLK